MKLANRRALVAIVALHSGVCPKQREPVLVILHLLNGDLPALDGVAIRTIRSHFSLVYIGVAILAVLSGIGKNRFHMALRAFHLFVHTPQRILRFVVIELGNGLDGLPGCGRVAVFTRDR